MTLTHKIAHERWAALRAAGYADMVGDQKASLELVLPLNFTAAHVDDLEAAAREWIATARKVLGERA